MREKVLLGNRPLFASADLDEVREQVARVFCPHRLDLTGDLALLNARFNSAQLGAVRISYLDYAADVRIEPGELESFFLVQIPLAGRSLIRCGGQEIVSTPALASLPSPTEYLDMRWAAGCPQLIVKFERAAVEKALEQLLGAPMDRPLVFDLGLDPDGGLGAGLARHGGPDRRRGRARRRPGRPAAGRRASRERHAHLAADHAAPPPTGNGCSPPARPRCPTVVGRAAQFIREHAHEPLTTEAGGARRGRQRAFAAGRLPPPPRPHPHVVPARGAAGQSARGTARL
ncbi:AraC family transcriptional regulator [Nonomuraea dietziae]|uniref:cupin domain-containing protein n=1 Tax=Nonomuraea dietziae TaxID=65515 RepID=UPI0031D08F9F